MKKKYMYIVLIILTVFLVVMWINKKNSDENEKEQITSSVAPEENKIEKTEEKSEIQLIETDFNANTFSGTTEIELLKELGVCDSTAPNDKNLDRPSCSPRFFKFFSYKKNAELRNNFILLLRSGVNGFPVRRLLIYERENGKLVRTNGFIGYIIEKRIVNNKLYDDIVIRFFERDDKQKYFYNCLFSWKNQRYEFVRCEKLGAPPKGDEAIKPELVDSVSSEIYKILIEKQLVF
jgi:hypothetical protein